jgi:uncharacterized protein YukE
VRPPTNRTAISPARITITDKEKVMAGPIVADQATITAMVNAFDECQRECKSIETIVDGAASNLGSNWQSDSASGKFLTAVDEWISGFHQIRQGLDMLNGNMQTYASLTGQTESGSTSYAGGWAAP